MPSGEAAVHPQTLGLAEAAAAVRAGRLTSGALLDACLAQIDAVEPRVKAWVHVDAPSARATAAERDAEARAGRVRGPLHGVPVGAKDIIDVAGMPTTGGARPWAHTRPGLDATCVARLRAAGAVVLGKTHTTQFAYRDPAPTANPWNADHTPGGSSSGSAAAVAARMVPLALGSQTVGSVLRPAAFCGVVGYKGTYGLVPVDGVIPLAWSFDHVGVLTRSVADAALGFGVLTGAGYAATPPARPPRLALAPELLARAEPANAAQIQAIATALAAAGASVTEVKLPAVFADLHAAGQVVVESEAAAYHEPSFRQHADEFGPGIRAGVASGLGHPAPAYVRANRTRLAFREEVMPILAAHDALLSPTAPGVAPRGLGWTGDASFCAPWSWSGTPSISLPSGVAPSGLPTAVQLTAAAGGDASLFAVAAWCERVLAFSAAPGL
ncbi:MAG: amidase [Candidatus Rokubacteria bacterium]|nr:amidase [Candidatus Rokubacteria bacterium]